LEPFIGSVCLCVCLYSDCKITKWIKLRMLETPPSETALFQPEKIGLLSVDWDVMLVGAIGYNI